MGTVPCPGSKATLQKGAGAEVGEMLHCYPIFSSVAFPFVIDAESKQETHI